MSTEHAVSPLQVTSETAPLRQVVVHTPGEEMGLVSPANRETLLFDDILFLEQAQEEHKMLCHLFERIVGEPDAVLELSDLVRETFEEGDARESFVEDLIRKLPERNFEAYESELKTLSPEALHRFAMTGQADFPITAWPLPNLLFTRDLSAVVGNHVILSYAATPARLPESAITQTIFKYHPRFAASRDHQIELSPDVSFEGGDLLVVNDKTVLIGQSERTSLGGVMEVAQQLLARTDIENVVMVNLPKERYCMHLDTVFTFADDDTCVVFPPVIQEKQNQIFHFQAGDEVDAPDGDQRFRMRVLPTLEVALNELTGRTMQFIACGGDDLIQQRREQWTDGANLFAPRPGLVVGYDRNRTTFDTLRQEGFHVVEASDFLDFYGDTAVPQEGRIAVRLQGNELSRGRGGPRCMTMPLRRQNGEG